MIVGGSKCVLADGECYGRLEWHHVVKQQRLRREFPHGAALRPAEVGARCWVRPNYGEAPSLTLADILGDTRNRVWLCKHHHKLVTNHRVDVPLPDSVWEFAREFGLDAALENDLARRNLDV